jgi:hypothetical protein
MPTYEFINTETDEQFEMFMSISERETFLQENQKIKPVMTAPSIVSHSGGDLYSKTPSGFKEVLSKVAEAHPNSVVADRYGKKSIKEARTRSVVDAHVAKVTKQYT